jgi:hypothetical protein
VAGEPISTDFDLATLQFTFRFCNYLQAPIPSVQVSSPEKQQQRINTANSNSKSSDASSDSTLESQWYGHPPEDDTTMAFDTEIFIPSYHYDEARLEICVSDGDWRYVKERQTLYYRHKDMKPGAVHSVLIKLVSGSPLPNNSSSTSINKTGGVDSYGWSKRAGGSPGPSKLKSDSAYGTSSSSSHQIGKAESDAGCVCTIM